MKYFKEMMEIDEPEPLVKAVKHMTMMLKDPDVQREGTFALAYKAITHGKDVVRSGGLDACLAAMNRHGGNERLQFDGCECLWRLAMDEDRALDVLQNGGLTAVLAALALHPESIRVQEEAMGALRWLAERDAKYVMEANGLEATMKVMESFPQFSWVQMWGCGALLAFARIKPGRVSDSGGFDAIKSALEKHGETSPEIARLGGMALILDPATKKSITRKPKVGSKEKPPVDDEEEQGGLPGQVP